MENSIPNETTSIQKKVEERVKVMHATLDHFLDTLGLGRGDVIIGGSLALFIQDMPVEAEIHDLDIELKDDPRVRELLSAMAVATTPSQDPSYRNSKLPRYDINYRGVKFNVWLVPNLEVRSYMYMNYFKYASIMSILKHKLSYRRPKDMKYFRVLMDVLTGYMTQED